MALHQITLIPPPSTPLSPGTLAQVASIIEATARKPGNVHPGASFADTDYLHFIVSAAAIAPALDRAAERPIGETVLEAVKATRALVGTNTNLGIILLLAPLSALPSEARAKGAEGASLRAAIGSILSRLTLRDAELVYEAIRTAAPGGLGKADVGDVSGPPAGTLLEMMALAAKRDLIARQYANNYQEVVEEGLPGLREALQNGRTLEEAVILCHLGFLSRHGDSLIERKCGKGESEEATRRAEEVLKAGWPGGRASEESLHRFDEWLRASGHRRNPGTSADLTAAALFLALVNGIIMMPVSIR